MPTARVPASITLIGPGAAGKTTAGGLLAGRLGLPFVDLDRCFEDCAGDISAYIARYGYDAYARQNVEVYEDSSRQGCPSVTALSSGFMTYPREIHPGYARLRQSIAESPTTFVLVPSSDRDVCIAETVRRQLARPFARSADVELAVIGQRFSIYVGLGLPTIETMRPIAAVVDELLAAICPGGSMLAPHLQV